jgi:tRNA modification GTPase
MEFDTITAISTPLGEGAIAIVRISGDEAIEIADRIFKGPGGKGLIMATLSSLKQVKS